MIRPYESEVFYDNMGMRLWERRHQKLDEYINNERVLDIGCNDGKFLQRLSHSLEFEILAGLDIDSQPLAGAIDNIVYDQIQDCLKANRKQESFVYLFKGDALKKYQKLKDFQFELITMIELIEHLELNQLDSLCDNVFGFLNPQKIIITTPNSDFNVYFKEMNPKFQLRHPDHKYEFTRQEFYDWTSKIANKYNYSTHYDGVGQHKSGETQYGYASQICVFTKNQNHQLNFNADENDIEMILKHCCPFDGRSDIQKLCDDILMNYTRFSLQNKQDLSDYEYDLLSNLENDQILMRVSDLPDSEYYSEIIKLNKRFTMLTPDYILLQLN